MNRSIVAQLVPSDPVWLRQVHGTEVVDADTAEGEPEADASVSTKPGVVCTVMTADCLPVLLANREGTVVAAVHAGWKSLAAGIIGKTIRVMRERAPESTGFVAWLAKMALAAEGVSEDDVFDCGLSTYSHPRRFYSFRRDGEKSGRHAAMIWIKPEEA